MGEGERMGEGFQYFDIILFALIAGFLVLRLRSVLGRRTGTERPRDLFRRTPKPAPGEGKVVTLPENDYRVETSPPAVRPRTLAEGLAQIRAADPQFEPNAFLAGARGAFELIVGAFAAGDAAKLRPLLGNEVYERFAEAIRQREAARQTEETRLEAIRAVAVEEAELNGRTAFVTVKFVSDQIHVLRGADGAVVDGDPEHTIERSDFWTFARNTRSQDPNWVLVATRSA